MAKTKGSHAPSRVHLSYQLLRNTTSPDEKLSGVQSFVTNLPAGEILRVGTRENLRSYIAEYNPRKRNRIHDAIEYTIRTDPERFITRNSGFVITASDIEIDDNKKILKLTDASIINGAQSQGEIRRYLDELMDEEGVDDPDELEEVPFHVRAELIIEADPDEVVETAIARNTMIPVKSISQAGARGHLDDLEKSIKRHFPNRSIRKSETDENVLDTRKILQWTRLLMPQSVSRNASAAEKLRAYKNPEQCLADFSEWFETQKTDVVAKERYEFTVQIAPFAIEEYEFWESHEAWNGHHIWEETKKSGRACRRDATGRIVWVAPGIVYPIVGAMSEFVAKDKHGNWVVSKPRRFKADEMVKRAVSQFRAYDSDPMRMGRSEAAYDALRIYPQTLVELLRDMSATGK